MRALDTATVRCPSVDTASVTCPSVTVNYCPLGTAHRTSLSLILPPGGAVACIHTVLSIIYTYQPLSKHDAGNHNPGVSCNIAGRLWLNINSYSAGIDFRRQNLTSEV